MIRIRRDEVTLNTLAEKHCFELMGPPYNVDDKFYSLFDEVENGPVDERNIIIDFLDVLLENFELLFKGRPEELQRIILETSDDFLGIKEYLEWKDPKQNGNSSGFTKFKLKLERVFDYNKFCRQYGKDKWGAYPLVQELNIKVCPYCNRNYINTFLSDEKRTRARLDHWYDKGSYPFLALSFYNLIPSCHTCNSDFKNSKPFNLSNNIHPYKEGFEDEYIFQTNVKNPNYVEGKTGSLGLDLKPASGFTSVDEIIIKAQENGSVFGIQDLYGCHLDLVENILRISYVYNQDRLNELMSFQRGGAPFFKSRKEILELVLGNFLEKDDFEKRPFSKLTRDIAQEQGLLSLI